MSGRRTDGGSGVPGRFAPSELDGAAGLRTEDIAGDLGAARELEDLAARSVATPVVGFADRVMDAIAAEPSPVPARVAGRAIRRGALGAFLVAVRDAWRVSTGPGFPMAVRAQALALVLVVAGVAAGSAAATAGALGLFDASPPRPAPSIEQPSLVGPRPEGSAEPTESEPIETPEASESEEPSETTEVESQEAATEHPEGTDDHGGTSGGSGGEGPDGTSGGTSGGDDHGGTGGGTATPRPIATDDSHDGGEDDGASTPDSGSGGGGSDDG
jgi:hypothetical protein